MLELLERHFAPDEAANYSKKSSKNDKKRRAGAAAAGAAAAGGGGIRPAGAGGGRGSRGKSNRPLVANSNQPIDLSGITAPRHSLNL